MVATFKVLVYCTLFIRPAVLFSAVEECRFRLANVCFGAARTGVAIYKTRVAKEWDSILICCEEGELCRLELDSEKTFYFYLKKSVFCSIWKEYILTVVWHLDLVRLYCSALVVGCFNVSLINEGNRLMFLISSGLQKTCWSCKVVCQGSDPRYFMIPLSETFKVHELCGMGESLDPGINLQTSRLCKLDVLMKLLE